MSFCLLWTNMCCGSDRALRRPAARRAAHVRPHFSEV